MARQSQITPSKSSSAARVLAPLALVACVLAVVAIVSANQTDSSEPEAGGERGAKAERSEPEEKEYVVQPGDTLTSIADEFGVSISRLERLNPDLDPQTLNSGQVVKLR